MTQLRQLKLTHSDIATELTLHLCRMCPMRKTNSIQICRGQNGSETSSAKVRFEQTSRQAAQSFNLPTKSKFRTTLYRMNSIERKYFS